LPRDSQHDGPGWPVGTVVSISRLPGPGRPMARALGIGQLLDPIAPGRTVRFRVDGGRALRPSAIVSLDCRGPDVVRFETAKSRYELRRIEGSATSAGVLSVHDELRAKTAALEVGRDETSVVEIVDWPEARGAGLVSGARVSVSKLTAGSVQELGEGVLLDDVRVGEPASFGLDQGVIGTSAILSVVERAKDRLELSTSNAVYRIELMSAENPTR